jgi:hypothetical protein
VDCQLFGEEVDGPVQQRAYLQKFCPNHQLLLKKESLTDELNSLLEVTKDGILQLRNICRGSPPKRQELVPMLEGETNFKKKQRPEAKTDRATKNEPPKQRENKIGKITIKKMDHPPNSENQTPRSTQ